MIVLGLTGSIGMGKSATAQMFADEGVPIWDADAAVRRLYDSDAGIELIGQSFPGAIKNNRIDRAALKNILLEDPDVFQTLERIVHPLVAADRQTFLAQTDARLVVLDIPLLFETDLSVDKIAVVTAPPNIQRDRVLSRGTMTEKTFEAILAKQVPDHEKRARADFVIETLTFEGARRQVKAIIEELTHNA